MVLPRNKRLQRAKNVRTNGGPMKAGLVPLTGKSPLLFKLPRQCCSRFNLSNYDKILNKMMEYVWEKCFRHYKSWYFKGDWWDYGNFGSQNWHYLWKYWGSNRDVPLNGKYTFNEKEKKVIDYRLSATSEKEALCVILARRKYLGRNLFKLLTRELFENEYFKMAKPKEWNDFINNLEDLYQKEIVEMEKEWKKKEMNETYDAKIEKLEEDDELDDKEFLNLNFEVDGEFKGDGWGKSFCLRTLDVWKKDNIGRRVPNVPNPKNNHLIPGCTDELERFRYSNIGSEKDPNWVIIDMKYNAIIDGIAYPHVIDGSDRMYIYVSESGEYEREFLTDFYACESFQKKINWTIDDSYNKNRCYGVRDGGWEKDMQLKKRLEEEAAKALRQEERINNSHHTFKTLFKRLLKKK